MSHQIFTSYSAPGAAAGTVTPGDRTFHIRFHQPQKAVTPGQWSVFYDDEDRVLAAGVIDSYTTLAEMHGASSQAATTHTS